MYITDSCLCLTLKCKHFAASTAHCLFYRLPQPKRVGRSRRQPSRTQAHPPYTPNCPSLYKVWPNPLLLPPHNSLLACLVCFEPLAPSGVGAAVEAGGWQHLWYLRPLSACWRLVACPSLNTCSRAGSRHMSLYCHTTHKLTYIRTYYHSNITTHHIRTYGCMQLPSSLTQEVTA